MISVLALYWADGHRSLGEIVRRVALETGQALTGQTPTPRGSFVGTSESTSASLPTNDPRPPLSQRESETEAERNGRGWEADLVEYFELLERMGLVEMLTPQTVERA